MTKMLEKAFAEASKLSEIEQNALARWLMEELEAEKKWDKTFADTENVLDTLANKAVNSHRQGKSRVLNVKDL